VVAPWRVGGGGVIDHRACGDTPGASGVDRAVIPACLPAAQLMPCRGVVPFAVPVCRRAVGPSAALEVVHPAAGGWRRRRLRRAQVATARCQQSWRQPAGGQRADQRRHQPPCTAPGEPPPPGSLATAPPRRPGAAHRQRPLWHRLARDAGEHQVRVRVEIMEPGKYENVGRSQPVLIMIKPIIFTRTRRDNRQMQGDPWVARQIVTGWGGVPAQLSGSQ
jgi:hypothetical protein